jgi:hypothetical protein
LLEFARDAGGANPRRTAVTAKPIPSTPSATRDGSRPTRKNSKPGSRLFPIEGSNLLKPVRRSPVDLETLQLRIHALEQRVLHQTSRIKRRAKTQDLDKLQLRMQRLEQSLNSELWAARQREHTMLDILSKPPLKTAVRNRFRQIWHSDLPAVACWLQRATASWWRDTQPGWWPRFAAAWQESLDQARR